MSTTVAPKDHSPMLTADGADLVVPGSAGIRPRVLERVQSAGGAVTGLTTEEGRLDKLFLELVGEARGHVDAGRA